MIPTFATVAFIVAGASMNVALPSASDVLADMAKQTIGLDTYEVPVTIHASIRKGILSIPVALGGERYFIAPDKEALQLGGVPAIAKAFSNIYASLGTPLTWPRTYDLKVVVPDHATPRPIYELRGTYKRASSVDHILLDVEAGTYDLIQVRWFYRNGATIVMTVQEDSVGTFRLPRVENVDVTFPGYRGHATIEYGAYAVNVAIPRSEFINQ